MVIKEIELDANHKSNLNLITLNKKSYWIIEGYGTDFEDLEGWEEITEELYDAIIKFNNTKTQ